jgi:molybdate transport system permease protein
LEEIARLMGAGPLRIFWHVSLPIARRGIGSGVLLALARSLGEFGATVMVLGILPSRQTLPIRIFVDFESDEMSRSAGAVIVLIAVSFLIILLYSRTAGRD